MQNQSAHPPKVEKARRRIMDIDMNLKVTWLFSKIPFLKQIHQTLVDERTTLVKSNNGRRALESLRKEGYSH